MLKERPILFSAPMVRAILEGRKTQTRRVVKPRKPGQHRFAPELCPYGKPGDRLWVRETWARMSHDRKEVCTAPIGYERPGFVIAYRASEEHDHKAWRPSIHMPRWASRILLEITDVRVERLQEISEGDAHAEGVAPFEYIGPDQRLHGGCGRTQGTHPHTIAFASLWDSINAKRGYGWATNPWVWVIEFKKLEPK